MTRGLALVALLAAAAGCNAATHGDFGFDHPDAGSGGGSDASVDADAAPMIDAPPACPTGRIVFLNFDGVTLHKGTSNALTDTATWLGNTNNATIPAYDTTRKPVVEAAVIAGLAQFPAIVVHDERPPAGPYVEVVFGGTRGELGNPPFDFAIAASDCGDTVKSDVAIVLNDVTNNQQAANFAIGAIGFMMGLAGTTDPNNCMCDWNVNQGVNCSTNACTLSTTASTANANGTCTGVGATQDQTAPFAAFCQ